MMKARQRSQLTQIEGKEKTQRSLKIQMGMTERERKSAQALVEKQYLSENILIDFDRDVEQLNSRMSEISTESHMVDQNLQELQMNHRNFEYTERFTTLSEMYRLQARKPQIESQVNLLRLRISRAALQSPVSGRVVNRRVNTVGATVESGQLLLELVPATDRLVLDVRLDPKDIEHVHPGSLAKVRFLAYSPRQYPPLSAKVDTVAADISFDNAGKSYYSVTLLPGTEFTQIAESLQLYPGMPAEATILTGSRTLMDYLLSPFINLRDRSLRER
jgi:HlyD family type I secretion membrane fusion protein